MSKPAQVAVRESSMAPHHPIFHRFARWRGEVPEGFIVNFLGVMTRAHYWAGHVEITRQYPADRRVETDYPIQDEEYFEWIDLLEAVAATKDHFTMLELGAGWGRWCTNAAFALKQLGGVPYTLVAVEAEPTHFQWLVEHVNGNGLDPGNLRLVRAAVARTDGKIGFHMGETKWGGPATWYGQRNGGPEIVDAVSLNTLLKPLQTVDLVDIDVQGAELEVLEGGVEELDKKVKRLHVATHSVRIHQGVHSFFARLGWERIRCFPFGASAATEWGEIHFQDGVQTWMNPNYDDPCVDRAAVLLHKLEAARKEGARLWSELDELRSEWDRAALKARPLRGKIRAGLGRLRDRLAPSGTRRRKVLGGVGSVFRRPE
jgi:FkbM family methyltransferase